MPIQEALVPFPGAIDRPAGVAFDPPCKTSKEDLKSWTEMREPLLAECNKGRYIMCLIQARNTRTWDDTADNFKFNPAEDYLIAAYSLSREIGTPYEPGIVAQRWLDKTITAQTTGRTLKLNADMIHMWQCSAQGCNLSTVGVMKLINFKMKTASHADAITWARGEIGNAQKYGWRGGVFPDYPAGRSRSGGMSIHG